MLDMFSLFLHDSGLSRTLASLGILHTALGSSKSRRSQCPTIYYLDDECGQNIIGSGQLFSMLATVATIIQLYINGVFNSNICLSHANCPSRFATPTFSMIFFSRVC